MTGEGIVPHVDDGIVGMSLGGSVVMHVCWGWRRVQGVVAASLLTGEAWYVLQYRFFWYS